MMTQNVASAVSLFDTEHNFLFVFHDRPNCVPIF